MKNDIVTVGIDVSSTRLDCYSSGSGELRAFDNIASGHALAAAFATEEEADMIAFEATGGYAIKT